MTDAAPGDVAESTVPGGAPAREPTMPGTRAWFVFFVLWMGGWASLALWGFHEGSLGNDFALRVWVLALACFYLSLCNAFIPLPTAWIVFLAAAPDYALVQTPWLRVLFIASLMSAVTAIANLNEYHLLAYLLRFGLGRRVRKTSLYGWALRWFNRSPFQLLLLFAFVPIPVDAIRWLAILRRYSRLRFGLAYFTGRGLRYVVFAACSTLLALGPRAIVLIQVGLVLGALLLRFVWRAVQRRSPAPAAAEVTTLAGSLRPGGEQEQG